MPQYQQLSSLPGLGPKSQAMLEQAGITSAGQLRELGSVRAFAMVRRAGLQPSLNLLWALEGALTGEHWQAVAKEHRTSLLFALEALERPGQPIAQVVYHPGHADIHARED